VTTVLSTYPFVLSTGTICSAIAVDFDQDAARTLANVQKQMAQKVAEIEKRLSERFDREFAAFDKRVQVVEVRMCQSIVVLNANAHTACMSVSYEMLHRCRQHHMFSPCAHLLMRVLKGMACRARVTPVSSHASHS
jgi:hypothetical protein